VTAPARPLRVLVTGAASGIGLGIAQYLASRGHRVWLSDLDGDAAVRATSVLVEAGACAAGLRLDVTSQSSIDAALAALGPAGVDLLVNNAGLQHVAPLEEFARERWELLVAVMLTGAAMLTRAALPGMRARGFGRIVNVGSIHSLVASPFKSAYVAAKHGLVGFSRSVALETADVDITVNTICPSYVKTPLVDKQIADHAKAHGISPEAVVRDVMLVHQARKEFVKVEELAALAVFLASDAAASLTAAALPMDGGWTQH
jgi:3-hydroxybutyrate dehydrogenase